MKSILKRLLFFSLLVNIICVSLAVYVIIQRGGVDYVRNKLYPANAQSTDVRFPQYLNRQSLFDAVKNNDRPSIIMLGDSITASAEWAELIPNKQIKNRGISADVTYGVLQRLDSVIQDNPSKIFILIGINDLGKRNDFKTVVKTYSKIIQEIKNKSPGTDINIQSVLPVNNIVMKKANGANAYIIDPVKIINLNKELKNIANQHSVNYIDLYSEFAGQENELKTELTYDGLHLNGDGYLLWVKKIQPYL